MQFIFNLGDLSSVGCRIPADHVYGGMYIRTVPGSVRDSALSYRVAVPTLSEENWPIPTKAAFQYRHRWEFLLFPVENTLAPVAAATFRKHTTWDYASSWTISAAVTP